MHTDNQVRRKLERGELVMGMMHFTGSPMLVEVMASAGLDFFIIDMEHSPIDLELAAHLVRTGDAAGITPLAREILARGVRMISYSADALVFRRACQDIAGLKVMASEAA